jgi:hypothetical protein
VTATANGSTGVSAPASPASRTPKLPGTRKPAAAAIMPTEYERISGSTSAASTANRERANAHMPTPATRKVIA